MISKQMLLGIAILALCAAGCGKSSELTGIAADRLRAVATVYLDFAAAKGTGPANERELLAHFRNVLFAAPAVDAGAQVLQSDRDGESFVVRYGLPICVGRGKSSPMIARERAGRDGKVLAAFANGKVVCVAESDIQEK
jgi:hypothetical protein